MKKLFCLILALCMTFGLCAQAAADGEKVELLCSISASITNPHGEAQQLFADTVKELSGGTVEIEMHYDGTLYSQADEKLAIASGDLDICQGNASWLATNSPWLGMLCAGYTFKNYDHMRAFYDGELGEELFQRIYEERDVMIVGVMYQGARQISLNEDKPIITPDDLAGINLRMPDTASYINLGKAMGLNPTPMAINELYMALDTGAVDGQENPLSTIYTQKFYEVQKSISLTNHVIDTAWIVINGETWRSLTEEQQGWMREAAKVAVAHCDELVLQQESELVDTFKEEGLSVYESDVDTFQKHVIEYYEENGIADDWDADLYAKIQELGEDF